VSWWRRGQRAGKGVEVDRLVGGLARNWEVVSQDAQEVALLREHSGARKESLA